MHQLLICGYWNALLQRVVEAYTIYIMAGILTKYYLCNHGLKHGAYKPIVGVAKLGVACPQIEYVE